MLGKMVHFKHHVLANLCFCIRNKNLLNLSLAGQTEQFGTASHSLQALK